MTHRRAVLGAAVAACGFLAATVVPAQAGVLTDYQSVQASSTNYCMEVPGGSTADSIQLRTTVCDGSAAQTWSYTLDSSGVWGELRSRLTGKCADIRKSSTEYGTVVQQYRCNGTSAQRFSHDTNFLRNQNSSLCIAVDNTTGPTGLTQWGCGGFYLTYWTLNP